MMLMCYQQLLTTLSITVDNEKVKGVFMCDLKNPNIAPLGLPSVLLNFSNLWKLWCKMFCPSISKTLFLAIEFLF